MVVGLPNFLVGLKGIIEMLPSMTVLGILLPSLFSAFNLSSLFLVTTS